MPKYESSRLKLGELALSVNFSKKYILKKNPSLRLSSEGMHVSVQGRARELLAPDQLQMNAHSRVLKTNKFS